MDGDKDAELTAMTAVWNALEKLDAEACNRVIAYVAGRLGLSKSVPSVPSVFPTIERPHAVPTIERDSATAEPKINDIRSFAQFKSPRTVTERAAVVAY